MSINLRIFARISLVTISLLALAGLGRATNYYVDYVGGVDGNNGTSTGSAWQHCPGDPTATGTPAGVALQAGDTVFFKGGVSYVLKAPYVSSSGTPGIALNWSGAQGNPITYDGNSAGNWGSGRATITDNYSANSLAAFSAQNPAHLTFKSFIFTAIGGSNSFPTGDFSASGGIPAKPGSGITAYTSMTDVYVDSCYFGQLGYYQNFKPIGASSLSGSGVFAPTCNGVTITNCEFTQVVYPVYFGTGNSFNLTVANCSIHDQVAWGITVLSVGSYRSNIFIHDNTFTNTDQYYVDSTQGGQWTAYGAGGPHCNAIMMYNGEGCNGSCALDRSPGDTNVFIYNNQFSTTMNYPGGSTTIWLQDSTSGYIYNNVFYLTAANNAIAIGEMATNTPLLVGIYNNTFYCNPISLVISASGGGVWAPLATGKLVNIKNNLFSTLNAGFNNAFNYEINTPSVAKVTNNVMFDYNFYFSDQTYGGQTVFGLSTANGFIMLSSGPSFGWDVHSLTGLPQFVNPTHASPYNSDLHLLSNSPALTGALNLSSLNLPGLSSDKDGNPRPAQGQNNWTFGAYQWTGAVVINPPSTNNPPTTNNPPSTNKPPTPTGFHILGQ